MMLLDKFIKIIMIDAAPNDIEFAGHGLQQGAFSGAAFAHQGPVFGFFHF